MMYTWIDLMHESGITDETEYTLTRFMITPAPPEGFNAWFIFKNPLLPKKHVFRTIKVIKTVKTLEACHSCFTKMQIIPAQEVQLGEKYPYKDIINFRDNKSQSKPKVSGNQ